jgi:PAS domain S-box-containing protein
VPRPTQLVVVIEPDPLTRAQLAARLAGVHPRVVAGPDAGDEHLRCTDVSAVVLGPGADEAAVLVRLRAAGLVPPIIACRREERGMAVGAVNLKVVPWPTSTEDFAAILAELSADPRVLLDRLTLFERLASASSTVLFLFDIVRQRPVWVSEGPLESLLGYSLADLVHMDASVLTRVIDPEDFPAAMGALERTLAARDGEVITGLFRMRRRDGVSRWFASRVSVFQRDQDGSVMQVVGSVADVHEQVIAERRALDAHRDLRNLIDNLPDFLVLYRDGRIVYINRAGLDFLGFAELPDVVGRPVLDFVHTDDRGLTATRLGSAKAAPIHLREIRLVKESGEVAWVEVAGGRTVEFDGERAALVVLRDVTQRRRIQSRLLLADRMASVGTLAAGVAHEINNPLTYVVGNLAYVAERLRRLAEALPEDAMDEMQTAIREAREGADRVRVIVGDLRTFSRDDERVHAPVDLHAVLDSTLNIAASELRNRARLVREYGDVAPVRANHGRLGQVFLNLLVNAMQAIPDDDRDDHLIRIRTWTEAGQAVVEIVDSGAGIPPEALAHVFDPFFTTKPVGVGTGLGLSICHNIVSAMGGEIAVESRVGRGATFRVSLPLATDPVPAFRAEPDPTPLPTRRRILIVDDEPTVARSIQRVLDGLHDVAVAHDTEAALERLSSQEFDLVLCDVVMPGRDGIALWNEVVRDHPSYARKFLFLTGAAVNPRVASFLAAQPNRWLEKPFDVAELLRLIAG